MSERSKILEGRRKHGGKISLATRRINIKKEYSELAQEIKATLLSPTNLALMIGGAVLNAIKIKPITLPRDSGVLGFFQKRKIAPLPANSFLDFALNFSRNPIVSGLLSRSKMTFVQLQVLSLGLLAAKKAYDYYRKRKNLKTLEYSMQHVTDKIFKKKKKGFFS